jgi:hypothetical protein
LIWVEEGAPSAQSKTIPSPSQSSQTILNPGGGSGGATCNILRFVIVFPQNKAAKRNMIA